VRPTAGQRVQLRPDVTGPGSTGKFATNVKGEAAESHAGATRTGDAHAARPGEWASVRSYGAVGDGVTDDTAAVQRTIDTNRVVYLPQGFYMVQDTIRSSRIRC
jgi:polygalacturonase